jgi:hypothetical protein
MNEFQALSEKDRKAEIARWGEMTKDEQAAWRKRLPATHKRTLYGKKKKKAMHRKRKSTSTSNSSSTHRRHTRANPQGALATQLHDSPTKRNQVSDTAKTKAKKKKRKMNTVPVKARDTHDAAVIRNEDVLLGRMLVHHNMTNAAGGPFVASATVPAARSSNSDAEVSGGDDDNDDVQQETRMVSVRAPVGARIVLIMQYDAKESRPCGKDHPDGVLHDPNDPSRSKFIMASTCSPEDTKKVLGAASLVLKERPPSAGASGATDDFHVMGSGDWNSVRSGGLSKRATGSLAVHDGEIASAVAEYQDERKSRRAGVRKSGPLSNEETNQETDDSIGVIAASPCPPRPPPRIVDDTSSSSDDEEDNDEPNIESESDGEGPDMLYGMALI